MGTSHGRSSRNWKENVRPRVLRGTHCERCGWEFADPPPPTPHPRSKEVDHIVPLSKLGPNDPRREALSNLRLLCRKCNLERGNAAIGEEDPTGGDWL